MPKPNKYGVGRTGVALRASANSRSSGAARRNMRARVSGDGFNEE